jgi:ribonuclease HI
MIELFTDGAASGNPGPGGFGYILRYKDLEKEHSEGFRLTTNNRMELMAVIRALQSLKRPELPVTVYSDSSYVVNAIEKGWLWNWQKKGFKDKKNVDLWQEMIPLLKKYKVKFVWVRGHDGHAENERCDQLAVAAGKQAKLAIDKGYENEINKPGLGL